VTLVHERLVQQQDGAVGQCWPACRSYDQISWFNTRHRTEDSSVLICISSSRRAHHAELVLNPQAAGIGRRGVVWCGRSIAYY